MYQGSLSHDDIIRAFRRNVPDCHVADYREKGGYIVVFRGLKNMPWKDQTTTRRVYHQVPAYTLVNLERGNITAATLYEGVRLKRPGWRQEFRKASRHLTRRQMEGITEDLGVGEVFRGIN